MSHIPRGQDVGNGHGPGQHSSRDPERGRAFLVTLHSSEQTRLWWKIPPAKDVRLVVVPREEGRLEQGFWFAFILRMAKT